MPGLSQPPKTILARAVAKKLTSELTDLRLSKAYITMKKKPDSLLKTKSQGTRQREKDHRSQLIDNKEREKVFQAIQSKQILVVDEFIQRNMLGLDCEDHSGNSLLNIAV